MPTAVNRPALLALAALCTAARADEPRTRRAAPAPAPANDAAPPPASIEELQRAALVRARLQPERMLALERRLRRSALLPQLRLRVGRGTGQLQTVTDYAGGTRLVIGDQNAWQLEVGATWNLDRLLFHPDETRLAREAERAAAHRERLLREVAELASERQRLHHTLTLAPPPSPLEAAEARLRIEELTALLDSLTGLDSGGRRAEGDVAAGRSGLLSPWRAAPPGPAAPGRRPGDRPIDRGTRGDTGEPVEAE